MWLRKFAPFHLEGRRSCSRPRHYRHRAARAINEDSIGHRVAQTSECWVLADGLGGHRGGEIASKLAVDAVLSSFETNPLLVRQP